MNEVMSMEQVDISMRPTGYRNYGGVMLITSLLFSIVVVGLISFFFHDLRFFRAGVTLVMLVMVVDFFLVHPKVLVNKWYIAHHLITIIWAALIFYYAESLLNLRLGFLCYMLLGAIFRRIWVLLKHWAPRHSRLHRLAYFSMVFFEFCDPIIILFCLGWLSSLPIAHQALYYSAVVIRMVINFKSYRKELKMLWQAQGSC